MKRHTTSKQSPGKIKVGTRVVRGPDWNHKCEDNGEGFLGTIVGISDSDRCILVIWDTGRSGRYRGGPNQYDLRVFDNAPTDVIHIDTMCFTCRDSPIHGMKWTCLKCKIPLCTQCYMDDKHDVTHIFERTNTLKSVRVKVTARQSEQIKIIAKGIFVGAEVIAGPHLTNGNKDENYNFGYVEQITNWKNKYHRGIIKVFWKDAELETLHRLGAEGCVDIICSRLTETAAGGTYYAEHLPVIDFDAVSDSVDVYGFSSPVDINQEQTQADIQRIVPTELTLNTKIIRTVIKEEIWKGEWILKTRKPVCIKRFKRGSYQDCIREASVMKLCHHDKVIKLYGITTTVDWIVMELFYDWNLLEYLRIDKENGIDMNQMLYIAAQVACGMNYLGTKRILHRDLRAINVLMNDKLETKIYGFHLAKVLKEDEYEYNPFHGEKLPIKWTAIEAALYDKFTFKSDVWSFGILLVELTTLGNIPYPGLTNRDCLEKLERGFRHEKPENCPENIYKIMLSCWNKEPTKRPTFEYLFNYFDYYVVSAELEREADFNPEQTQLDIYRILQTELTFDKKISEEKEVGQIWKGEWILKTRKPVCIKLFQEGEYKDFIREASIMKLCRHNNVVKLYGITTSVDWIVMEFVYDLNLLEYMRIDKENKIDFNQMLHIAAQVACGMNYLGTNRIVHIDLRAANVFINDYHVTKIYGFHLARVLGKDKDEFEPAHGDRFPIKWTAIEAALYGKFTIKSDVWSFGIFLVELTTLGQIPYQGITNRDILEKIEMGFRHEKPDNCPENVYKLMLRCWNKVPTNRPTFEYLFNYFDDYVVSSELEKEDVDSHKEITSYKDDRKDCQVMTDYNNS